MKILIVDAHPKKSRAKYLHDWRMKNIIHVRKKDREYYYKRKKLVFSMLGNKCVICPSTKRLLLHEVHGKKHPSNPSCDFKYALEHIDDFVILCHECHEALHRFARISNNKITKKLLEMLK